MATDAKLRIGPADDGRALPLDDYLDAEVETGFRYEMARGVLEVTTVPAEPHRLIVFTLYQALFQYQQTHPEQIDHFGGAGEFQFVLPDRQSERNPDVAVVLAGAARDARGQRRASIAVEVVSPGARARERDLVAKRDDYLAYGLDEYWIVDPTERRVLVQVRDGDRWIESPFVAGQQAEGRALPGFRVPVEELWAAHDRGLADEPGEG